MKSKDKNYEDYLKLSLISQLWASPIAFFAYLALSNNLGGLFNSIFPLEDLLEAIIILIAAYLLLFYPFLLFLLIKKWILPKINKIIFSGLILLLFSGLLIIANTRFSQILFFIPFPIGLLLFIQGISCLLLKGRIDVSKIIRVL